MSYSRDNGVVHRLRQVREQSETSLRAVASRTGIPIGILRKQQDSNEISLVDFLRWQRALNVPFEELLQPIATELADHIRVRAGLVRLVRSIKSLLHDELTERQATIVENIIDQLNELMPELRAVPAWPAIGSRRSQNEPAVIESQMIDTNVWCGDMHEA